MQDKHPTRLPREILSEEDVASHAQDFLLEHHPGLSLPVPIREIAEFGMGIAVLPDMMLEDVTADGIDAYLTPDLQEIRVDQHTFLHVPTRCAFSIAHEVAHAVLHKQVYTDLASGLNIAEYRELMSNLDLRDLGFIEWQANCFAGRVLVPPTLLKPHVERVCDQLGIDKAFPMSGGDLESVVQELRPVFGVSANVLKIRCGKDGYA